MTKSLMIWASRQILPANHAIVLRQIAWSVGLNSSTWKGQDRLSVECNGISLSTFKRCVKDLSDLRLVKVGKCPVDGHLGCTYSVDTTRLVRWGS